MSDQQFGLLKTVKIIRSTKRPRCLMVLGFKDDETVEFAMDMGDLPKLTHLLQDFQRPDGPVVLRLAISN